MEIAHVVPPAGFGIQIPMSAWQCLAAISWPAGPQAKVEPVGLLVAMGSVGLRMLGPVGLVGSVGPWKVGPVGPKEMAKAKKNDIRMPAGSVVN